MSLDRQLLLDYVMGHPTQKMAKTGLENTENFGCGDDKDEDHWLLVIDEAINKGLLKARTDGINVTAKGKKFLKKPTSFPIGDAEDEEAEVGNIEGFVEEVIQDDRLSQRPKENTGKSTTSQRKMALIQAIDRHVALDDFASNHSLDFDEVMDDIEGVLATGTKLDLNYFGLEVLGEEAMEELFEYFDNAKTDNLELAFDEYGDVYKKEELRLGRILWRVKRM